MPTEQTFQDGKLLSITGISEMKQLHIGKEVDKTYLKPGTYNIQLIVTTEPEPGGDGQGSMCFKKYYCYTSTLILKMTNFEINEIEQINIYSLYFLYYLDCRLLQSYPDRQFRGKMKIFLFL